MTLNWLRSTGQQASHDPVVVDADGHPLHTYDDIVLLHDVQTDSVPEELQFFRGTIPAGTTGTIIIIDPASDEASVHLEFNIDHKLAFAHIANNRVRLHRHREEKLSHA
jgi:hypothetical protein